ncbi:hypothetical protein E2C01_036701 [Portunus trituberculatus]|uniref:Uncharacterized protein n=1 Tax=Portunus trituberculatus TaxID=210409 RepID=A0A5B7FD62_PORTR|nr:hypothetical protein [Portunus trituberculatus]
MSSSSSSIVFSRTAETDQESPQPCVILAPSSLPVPDVPSCPVLRQPQSPTASTAKNPPQETHHTDHLS